MMAREKFANRRATTTINFLHKHPGRGEEDTVCASFSRLPSGRIGEVWINSINGFEKLVTHDLRTGCVILSFGLQIGAPLDSLKRSVMRDKRGPLGILATVIDVLMRETVDA